MSLFETLPDELFKPLASPSRRFYADLLVSLHEKTFGLASEAPKRAAVIAEIADFTARWESANGPVGEVDPRTGRDDRARTVYQRLLETGWLIEHRDRYIRLVDLDPDASGLLHVFSTISRGETRTYGGAVVGVLSALESAAANPSERSESLRNAIAASRDFLAHMRTVSATLRKVEERILAQTDPGAVFRSFFEDFVQKHLIADFKTLHTKNNPFRFRAAIISQCRSMAASPLTVMALGEAYHREGRAPSASLGQMEVLDDLAVIVSVFESTEGHLQAIDATAARVEKRIVNTARYMDRAGRGSEASLIEAMRLAARLPDGAESPAPSALLPRATPIGPPHVAAARRERPPIAPSTLRRASRDEAFDRFLAAKEHYHRRTRVTPTALLAYLDRVMGDAVAVRGSSIRIRDVDDFIVFQRLRELPTIFDGAAARRYDFEPVEGRVSNDWIECQDFVIRRRKGAGRASA